MRFADGAYLCNRSHFHATGLPYYVAPNGDDPILTAGIDGKIKYTPDQFVTLTDEGKLDNPIVKAMALSGMRQQDAWAFYSEDERSVVEEDWKHDEVYFNHLKIKNLVSRGIKGPIAKFYNVRVGLDSHNQVERHYYPRYDESKQFIGAKCRTLPKDFHLGTLGKMWGEGLMFGQNTLQDVLDGGRRKDKLIICGGELDAMAAQQMLVEAQAGTKYAGQHYHIWSPFKGEMAIKEIIAQKEEIAKFKQVLVAFDNDEVGQKMNGDVARLFRGKAMKIQYPAGCKDANECLQEGRHKEFVEAFWNPVEVFAGGGKIKRVSALIKEALKTPEMGQDWPWPSMNHLTFGIRPHGLYVMGAGTGVGKTESTKEIVFHLIEKYDEEVGVIYLEEPAPKTVRSFAGKLINKRIEEPQINDKEMQGYSQDIDYTEQDAEDAIYQLESMDRLLVADTGGQKDIDTVMELIEEFLAMGITKIVIDNLTAIELPKSGSKVEAIDEAMKRIGTFKDEKPVSIFLLAHLKRPQDPRVPHEMGGQVQVNDFRGSGSINFWANVVIGIERNTYGETDEEKRMTTYRIVKCRDRGVSVNQTVVATMSPMTGRLLEPSSHSAYQPPIESKKVEPQEPDLTEENEEF